MSDIWSLKSDFALRFDLESALLKKREQVESVGGKVFHIPSRRICNVTRRHGALFGRDPWYEISPIEGDGEHRFLSRISDLRELTALEQLACAG